MLAGYPVRFAMAPRLWLRSPTLTRLCILCRTRCIRLARYPNVYGIDMPTREELVAHGRTEEEVAAEIGADAVIYLDLPALKQSVMQFNPALSDFDSSVFDGNYVTGAYRRPPPRICMRASRALANAGCPVPCHF